MDRSERAFLRRGGRFESIGFDLLPHLLRQWGEPIGTPNLQIFLFCNRLQQIATVCNSFSREPDFCNSLQQFATDCNNCRQQRPLPDSQKPGSGT